MGLPYMVNSDRVPGLAKLVEEMGELQQVLGKVMALGEIGDHWDGNNLGKKLVEELADVHAALIFFEEENMAPGQLDKISKRLYKKVAKFRQWREELRA